jgi:hypothetical protein
MVIFHRYVELPEGSHEFRRSGEFIMQKWEIWGDDWWMTMLQDQAVTP